MLENTTNGEKEEMTKTNFLSLLYSTEIDAFVLENNGVMSDTPSEVANVTFDERDLEDLAFGSWEDDTNLSSKEEFSETHWVETEYNLNYGDNTRKPIALNGSENMNELDLFLLLFPISFWEEIVGYTNQYKRKNYNGISKSDISLYDILMYLNIYFVMASNPKSSKSEYWRKEGVGLAPAFNLGDHMPL